MMHNNVKPLVKWEMFVENENMDAKFTTKPP